MGRLLVRCSQMAMCWSPESRSSLPRLGRTPVLSRRLAKAPPRLCSARGNVLLTGFRQECKGCGFKPSNAAVLYEVGTNTYAFTGGMNSARVFDSAVRLPNGQLLVSGAQTPHQKPMRWSDTGFFSEKYRVVAVEAERLIIKGIVK